MDRDGDDERSDKGNDEEATTEEHVRFEVGGHEDREEHEHATEANPVEREPTLTRDGVRIEPPR